VTSSAAQLLDTPCLLDVNDGSPFEIINPYGESDIVLICEHASHRVPEQLHGLGLSDAQIKSHIGWDPGARNLPIGLSKSLNAPLIAACFSRLVYDCNRPPEAPSSMPHKTEVCEVPGNENISLDEKAARASEIYNPFHAAVSEVIRHKRAQGVTPVIVTVHSFTPVFNGEPRAVEIGYLHGEDDRLSKALQNCSSARSKHDIRLNEPYAPKDGVLHTIDKHLENGTFPYVMIEVRNDLLTEKSSFPDILSLLSTSIPKAVSSLDDQSPIQDSGNL